MTEGINRMRVKEFEEKAMTALIRLGYGEWRVCWHPDPSYSIRGRAVPEKLLIEVFDMDENEAWNTFLHEVIEIKLRSTLRPYRLLINSLIGVIQEISDNEKDLFIESLLKVYQLNSMHDF